MNKFSRDLVQGMQEAAAFVEGKKVGAREHVVEVPDVRAIRQRLHQRLHMSQQRFAETYRIPLPTLKNWEQGRRAPDAPAAASQHCRRRRLRGFDCPSSWPAVPQPDRRRRCCGRRTPLGGLTLASATADTSSYHRRSNELQD